MSFIDLFLQFIDKLLDFEILGFSLYTFLITISIVVIAFIIIYKMIKD